MIRTIIPYGAIDINEILFIGMRFNTYRQCLVPCLKDKYGWWEIDKKTYEELKAKGIKVYE